MINRSCVHCGMVNRHLNALCGACHRPLNETATKCGCGRHEIELNGVNVVNYQGKWWLLKCLFFRVDKRMPKVIEKYRKMEREASVARKQRLKFIKMKNFIRRQPCVVCDHPAGNRFVQIGDDLYCGQCSRSTG